MDSRDRRPSVQRDEATISRTTLAESLPCVVSVLALVLTHSLHIGYGLGFGPAVAGQLVASVLTSGVSDLLRTFCLTSIFAGAAGGALLGGGISHASGRRLALLSSVPPGLLGWLLFAVSRRSEEQGKFGLSFLIIGRIFVGLSAGVASVAVPVWISEVAPARLRGGLVCLHQFGIGAGFTLAYAIGWATTDATDTDTARGCTFCGWRLAAWFGMVRCHIIPLMRA